MNISSCERITFWGEIVPTNLNSRDSCVSFLSSNFRNLKKKKVGNDVSIAFLWRERGLNRL